MKGKGRFVLAATQPVELADDAKSRTEPSPFTGALVQALLARKALQEDGDVTLEDLYDQVIANLPRAAAVPTKQFDGSGYIVIARDGRAALPSEQPRNGRPEAETPGPQSADVVAERAGADSVWEAILGRLILRARKPGDLSLSDVREWVFFVLGGIISFAFCIVVLAQWNNSTLEYPAPGLYFDPYDFSNFVWVGGATVASLFVVLLSLFEAYLLRRKLASSLTRRDVVRALDSGMVRIIRRLREATTYPVILLLLAHAFGWENYHPLWICALGILIVFAYSSATSRFGCGDAGYLAGALLIISSTLIPLEISGELFIPFYTASGAIELVVGCTMVVVWKYRAGLLPCLLACLLGALPAIGALFNREINVNAYLVLVAVGAAVLSRLLGYSRTHDEVSLIKT